MRIGGIASGIDTESIIKNLMKVERQPLDRFFQQKQRLEWQRDAYRDMNLQLKNLHDSASSIRLRGAFNTREAVVTDTKILAATANASVRNGTYKIDVSKIANSERYVSNNELPNLDADVKLDTAIYGAGFTITTYSSSGEPNKKEFHIEDRTLNEIFKEINESDLGVRVFYDSVFKKVVIEKKDTGIWNSNNRGNGREIEFGELDGGTDGVQKFLNNLKLDISNPSQHATNASFSYTDPILGTQNFTNIKTNRATVGGITLSLLEEGQTTITVSSNTDEAFNRIKDFVNNYNEVISTIRSKLSEQVNRGFPPLTVEQRRELPEKEADLWDERAKSGLLSRDATLDSVLNRMRLDLYSPVSTMGQYNHLAKIGIRTSTDFRENGKLEIDEAELRAALADDPDAVHQLFNNSATNSSLSLGDKQTYDETGLIGRLRFTIDDAIKKIESRAGNQFRTNQQFSLGRDLINIDQQIDRFQRRLSDIENRYWSQFTAMEKAMNQANSQAMAFINQLMGTGN